MRVMSIQPNAHSARPRESGDPGAKNWIPAFAGMSGRGQGTRPSFETLAVLAPQDED